MADNNDLVSVIIRTKDRPFFLKRAIDSICSQDYKNIEIIVVNDGGEDVSDTVNYYESKNSQINFEYINNKVSVLRSRAANIGLDAAKGKYLCLLDDDDYFYKNHLSKNIETQKKDGSIWSISESIESIENNEGVEINKKQKVKDNFDLVKFYFFENCFASNSIVFQRKIIDKVGKFDEKLNVLEDWDLWIRMRMETEPSFINEVTNVYTTRKGESNVRTSFSSRNLWKDSFLKIMKKYRDGVYDIKKVNLPLIQSSKFLSNHMAEWYSVGEEYKELKDSLLYKIYKSNFYLILKKIGRMFKFTREFKK